MNTSQITVDETDLLEPAFIPVEYSSTADEFAFLYSSRFPTRYMLSGALGAIGIHLLVLFFLLVWPELFPRDEFRTPVFMVNLVSVEPGNYQDEADAEMGSAEDARKDGLADAGSLPPIASEPEEAQKTEISEPFSEPAPPEAESLSEELHELETPKPEPLNFKSEKMPKAEIVPKKAKNAAPKKPKASRTAAGSSPVKEKIAASSSHFQASASSAPPSPPMQGPAPLDAGTGVRGNESTGSARAATKDVQKGAGMGSARQEFQLAQVDKPPEVLSRVEPDYPRMARRQKLSGKVVVKFLVDPKGRVQKQSVIEADPQGIFETCVLEAIARWRFKPGYYKGDPVSTWIVMPIRFKLSG